MSRVISPEIQAMLETDEVSTRLLLEVYLRIDDIPQLVLDQVQDKFNIEGDYLVFRLIANDNQDLTISSSNSDPGYAGKSFISAEITRGAISTSTDGKVEKVEIKVSNKWQIWAAIFANIGNIMINRQCKLLEYFPDFPNEPPLLIFDGIINGPKMTASEFVWEVRRSTVDFEAESPNMTYDPGCQYTFKDCRCRFENYTSILKLTPSEVTGEVPVVYQMTTFSKVQLQEFDIYSNPLSTLSFPLYGVYSKGYYGGETIDAPVFYTNPSVTFADCSEGGHLGSDVQYVVLDMGLYKVGSPPVTLKLYFTTTDSPVFGDDKVITRDVSCTSLISREIVFDMWTAVGADIWKAGTIKQFKLEIPVAKAQFRLYRLGLQVTNAPVSCDKTMVTCIRYGNVKNFGGHPSVPREMVIR